MQADDIQVQGQGMGTRPGKVLEDAYGRLYIEQVLNGVDSSPRDGQYYTRKEDSVAAETVTGFTERLSPVAFCLTLQ